MATGTAMRSAITMGADCILDGFAAGTLAGGTRETGTEALWSRSSGRSSPLLCDLVRLKRAVPPIRGGGWHHDRDALHRGVDLVGEHAKLIAQPAKEITLFLAGRQSADQFAI